MQEMDDLLVGDFAGQFVDVVAAVNQLADVALDITEAGLGGDDASRPLLGLGAVEVLMRWVLVKTDT